MFQKATKLAKRVVGCTALALTVCTVLSPIDAAQARTPFVVTGQRNHSFAAVRNFYTPYQPSVRAATGRYGFYAPWAVKRPSGMPMRGTPFLRALCAVLGPAC